MKTINPYGVIYKFENLVNGKVYIGQTTNNIEKYITGHYYNSLNLNNSKVLYKAIRKHHIRNFKIQILCTCYSDFDLNWAEDFYILEWYNSISGNLGYNMKSNSWGVNQEVRNKISKTTSVGLIERWKDEKFRDKVKEGSMTWNKSVERQEISRRTILTMMNDPIKNKARLDSIKKSANTPEFKHKISIQSQLKWKDPKFRSLRQSSQLKTMSTELYRTNCSIAQIESYKRDPSRITRRLEKMKILYQDQEYLNKISKSTKEAKARLKKDPIRSKKDSDSKKAAWLSDPSRKQRTSKLRGYLSRRFDFKLQNLSKKYSTELIYLDLVPEITHLLNNSHLKLEELKKDSTNLKSDHKANRLITFLLNLNILESTSVKGKYKIISSSYTNLIYLRSNELNRRITKCQKLISKFQRKLKNQ